MAKKIIERHGATPYGFYFTTRFRGPKDFDSKQEKQSCMYFLGGEIFTLKQIKDRKDRKDKTLIFNMEANKYKKVLVNSNSWKVTQPLGPKDVVLDFKIEEPVKS